MIDFWTNRDIEELLHKQRLHIDDYIQIKQIRAEVKGEILLALGVALFIVGITIGS
ncbi:MAG: hypothetical protein K0U20_09265 [Proteobacteria bacterium]|nr:hypothetical protein [Pseudomonadota bacterium]MCH9735769.1 hypothetical protein [Actinomycetes bacterium]